MAGVIDRLSYVLVPCALGARRWNGSALVLPTPDASDRVFVMQMESASLQLVNDLARSQTQP